MDHPVEPRYGISVCRGTSVAALSLIAKFIFMNCGGPRDEFPEAWMSPQRLGSERYSLPRSCARAILSGSSSFVVRRFDPSRTSRSLCSRLSPPGRDRHRERAAVQRNPGAQRGIARGPGASDRNGRGARHHQPVADGRAAGPRRHRRERGPGLWD